MNELPPSPGAHVDPAAPHPDVPAASSPLRAKWRAWLIMLVVLGGVVASVTAVRGGSAPTPSAPPADVPRFEDGQIVFTEAFRRRIQLTSEEVRSAPLTPVVSAVGTVTFDPRHMARVGTRLGGVVRMLHVYEGAEAKRGQPLAEIYSPELGEAQAQVTMLRAQVEAAARHATREAALTEKNLSTAQEAEEAAAERSSHEAMLRAAEQKVAALTGGTTLRSAELGVHTVTAPIDGTIVERHITRGELVEGDRIAFLVAHLDHLWVELDVFERSLAAIRVGDEVEVQPLSGAGGLIKGRVAQVGAVMDPATRSAPVRIELDNTERHLRPGQAVDATIKASNAAQDVATLVPASSVTFVDGQPTVFVLASELAVVPTTVELGQGNGEDRQVLKGLAPGQRVVVKGVFELKSELFR